MTQKWKKEYHNLNRFIAANPEIKITASVTRVPQELRSDYFDLFEEVRTAFVLERHSGNLQKANHLGSKYREEKKGLISKLGLETITQDGTLELFLNDPMTRFIHDIHDSSLKLLKGLVDEDDFEEACDSRLMGDFYSLYSAGYNRWIMLALSKLLNPDAFHQVVLEEVTDEEVFGDVGFVGRYVPSPKISITMSFERPGETKFIIPDIIIYSSLARRYISMRSEIKRALVVANNQSEELEWLKRKPVGDIEPNIILLYSSKNQGNLRLISDKTSIAVPEMIIQTVAIPEHHNFENFQRVRNLNEELNPLLGTFIVFNGEIPSFIPVSEPTGEAAPPELKNDQISLGITALSIGFDWTALQPVLDKFTPSQKEKLPSEAETQTAKER